MAFDLVKFMDALAAFIAGETALNYATVESPRAIWRNEAIDDGTQCTPVFTVLRCYPGGTLDWVPLMRPAIQVETIGANDAALTQAMAVFRALTDSQGRPLRFVDIETIDESASFRINGVLNLGVPGLVGRDEQQRAKVVFNFEAEALALPAS